MARNLTEQLLESRMTVVSVDPSRGKVVVRGSDDVCSDLSCSGATVVAREETERPDLSLLLPGDLIKVQPGRDGHAEKIVVLRHAWQETESPET